MKLAFFFDPGSGVCLWAGDNEARAAFGYPIALEKLFLPRQTIAIGLRLIERFDTSINWSNPSGPSPWSGNQRDAFIKEATEFLNLLRVDLGQEFDVLDEVSA